MKIIIASEIYPPNAGGPATFVKRITPILKENDFNVKIITYADSHDSNDGIVRIKRSSNLLLRYFNYFKKLKKLAKDSELIFCQGPIASGLPAILIKKLTGRRVIIKVVGDVAWERARNKGWVTEVIDDFQNKKHGWRVSFQKYLRSYTTKNADLVITPSEYLKGIVHGWGVPKKNIKVIYNSFEARPAEISKEEARRRVELDGEVILSVGRLASWKGFDTLIDLMPPLLMINRDFKLVIVGSGPEEEKLKQKVSDLKLEGKVILTGQKQQSEMAMYYRAADIFILNSAYEGLSHTLLESLSYKLPTIASNKGGNPEVIEHDYNGLLVEYNNQQEILKAIKILSANKELQNKFISNSEKVLKKFVFDTMINEYLTTLNYRHHIQKPH